MKTEKQTAPETSTTNTLDRMSRRTRPLDEMAQTLPDGKARQEITAAIGRLQGIIATHHRAARGMIVG